MGVTMKLHLSNKAKMFFYFYIYFLISIFVVLIGGKYLIRAVHGVYHLDYLIEWSEVKIILIIPLIISCSIVCYYDSSSK